ncbi:MAG: hypothetical protein PHT49_02995 [Desulfovibrionales bacterium]|nr:hypothetical protein [Desulfovibrionales bacterium]
MAKFLTVEDSLRLAAGSFSFVHVLHERYMALLAHLARRRRAVAGRHFYRCNRSPLTVDRSPKKTFFALFTDNGGRITGNTITIDCSPKKRFSAEEWGRG